ncbi:hypothetical protein [Nocardia salmonicida]|uniref:hypothetical protein n=1 Tax=Nocardia salmonicida TaxID=53431 RepID=UPI002E29F2BF|nr:hypothetical protein [Nocardia salmonicida]
MIEHDILEPVWAAREQAAESVNDVGGLLAESRRLLDRAIAEHRGGDRGRTGDIVRFRPDGDWEHNLSQMLQRVRKEAVLAVSSPLRMQPRYLTGTQLISDHLAKGKQFRLLYSPHFAETRRDDKLLGPQVALQAQIKVTNADFHNMVIIDRRAGAIWGGAGGQRPYGFMIADPGLLRVIHQLATSTWDSAPAFSTYLSLCRREFDETTLTVLRALDIGLKDEVASRRLGVSLRTYRRYVADIMTRLGVTTRFQIGARATELGLISPHRGLSPDPLLAVQASGEV